MEDEIGADTKVMTLFREYPEVMDYLLSLGICECEGIEAMTRTLGAAAAERGLDLEEVLGEIRRRIE